jgi:hypothetical protein
LSLKLTRRSCGPSFEPTVGHHQRDFRERLQRRLDLLALAVGVLEARADRRVEPQRDEALVRLRDELGADERARWRSSRERDERDRDHALAMPERPLEDRAVELVQPVDAVLDVLHEAAEPGHALERDPGGSCQTAESIGSSVNETNSETSTATATVTPNWKKKRR